MLYGTLTLHSPAIALCVDVGSCACKGQMTSHSPSSCQYEHPLLQRCHTLLALNVQMTALSVAPNTHVAWLASNLMVRVELAPARK